MLDFLPPLIHGTTREHYVLLFGAAGLVSLVVGGMAGWIGAYFGARRASRRAIEEIGRDRAQLADARFAALAQTLEAMALEVERVAEGQRFTTRVLSERSAVAAPLLPRREPGIVTPH